MSDTPLLQLQGITKTFGSVQALSDVDFEVRTGEVFGCHRQYLLFVLRVGAFAESVLPPRRVSLPEIVAHRRAPDLACGPGRACVLSYTACATASGR